MISLLLALVGAWVAPDGVAPMTVLISSPRGDIRVPVRTDPTFGPMVPAPALLTALAARGTVVGAWAELEIAQVPFRLLIEAPFYSVGTAVKPLVGAAVVKRDTLFLPIAFVTVVIPLEMNERFHYSAAAGRLEDLTGRPLSSGPIAAAGRGPETVELPGGVPLAARRPNTMDLVYHVTTSMLMDSNLDHDESPTPAVGGVFGMGMEFRSSRDRPVVTLRYEGAGHRYSIPNRWNRISHAAAARVTLRPAKWLYLTSDGEVTLKGSSEDRDLGDQYLAKQTIEWRPARSTSLAFAGAVRLRRYPDNLDRNGTNRYLLAELTQDLLSGVELSVSGRTEANVSTGSRYRYTRETIAAGLEVPGPAGVISVGGKARWQAYADRLVDLPESPGLLRRDWRYQASVEWELNPSQSLGVEFRYQYEGRRSNDPDKLFVANQVGFSITRTW